MHIAIRPPPRATPMKSNLFGFQSHCRIFVHAYLFAMNKEKLVKWVKERMPLWDLSMK